MGVEERLVLGIDVGTGGVRALAVTLDGTVVGRSSVSLERAVVACKGTVHEQLPAAWWEVVCEAIGALIAELKSQGISPEALTAVAVDGTSGTVVALDAGGEAVRPGMMYNDGRAVDEAEEINGLAGEFCRKLGYRHDYHNGVRCHQTRG